MKKFMWFLVLSCSPAWAYAQSYPAYVTDGKSLSKIDLSTLETTNVGDFPSTLGTGTFPLQLSYDRTRRVLYAFDPGGGNIWTIDKDTAQTQGPFHLPEVVDSSGHTVGLSMAAFCYWTDTFYVLGISSDSGGMSLISINPSGWEVVGVADYERPALFFGVTCAAFDDWNGTLLAAGWYPRGFKFNPPGVGVLAATSLNLGSPVTEAGFTDYQGNPVLSMTVDPVSSDLFAIDAGPAGYSPPQLIRIKRGDAATVTPIAQVQVPWGGIAFEEPPPSVTTQIGLMVPETMIQGDQSQLAGVTVTASDGSVPMGKVQLSFSGFGTFTHELADGSTCYTLDSLPAGTYQVQATYPYQGNYPACSSDIYTLTVSASP
jgi:hypothetical protein